MDLRNLATTPNQLDSVIQRRPSLSSLSSTSGYDSSTYGNSGGNSNVIPTQGPGASTPQMGQQRLSTGNRVYSDMLNNSSNTNLISAAPIANASPLATDVGPWVEQQKQQQSLNVASLDNGKSDPPAMKTPHSPATINISTVTANSSTTIDDDDDDELIPTAIVIKNIPFAIKKEQLLDVMTKLNLPLPYAFNYHFDNGVFRGLAFANFTSTDETSMVVNQLNGREIGGRKLRVEYKKMLPAQERERIEREKREKRGQLEEQHRSASNASLASMISATSTTAATKNLSVNGQTFPTQTERLFAQFPSGNSNIPLPPKEVNFNDPEVLELYSQLLTYRDDNSKLIYELAFPASLSMGQRKVLSLVCGFLNLLELFDNGLIIIRRKPGQQSIQQRQQQTATFTHIHHQSASGGSQNQASTPAAAPIQQSHLTSSQNGIHGVHPLHSSSMMNLNQLPQLLGSYPNNVPPVNAQAPELLRSHSQSALPLPRLRQQASTPVQQQYSQYQTSSSQHQKPPHGGQGSKYLNFGGYSSGSGGASGQQAGQGTPTSSSAAALLRNSSNRSFVDVRSTPAMSNAFAPNSVTGSPTPLHQAPQMYHHQSGYYVSSQGAQISQPGTPLASNDLSNRFAPFGQHAHLSGSMSSLQGGSGMNEEFPLSDPMSGKLNSLHLSGGLEQQKSSSGIWGPKK